MHGILLPSALISPHKSNKYHEYLSLRDFFLPQITQIIKIFFFFWFACFRRCLKLCSTDYTDFLSLRDVFISLTELKVFEPLDDKMHGIHGNFVYFCLFPTDNTDFINFCHFFTFGSKTVGSFGIVQTGLN